MADEVDKFVGDYKPGENVRVLDIPEVPAEFRRRQGRVTVVTGHRPFAIGVRLVRENCDRFFAAFEIDRT
jgi:hypothetical protein